MADLLTLLKKIAEADTRSSEVSQTDNISKKELLAFLDAGIEMFNDKYDKHPIYTVEVVASGIAAINVIKDAVEAGMFDK